MPALAITCASNQWRSENFRNQVDADEEQEVRVAAAYSRPSDRAAIRKNVIGAILACAIPAGNA